eukprot:3197997-Alexandrium_andersonii.AAC.1
MPLGWPGFFGKGKSFPKHPDQLTGNILPTRPVLPPIDPAAIGTHLKSRTWSNLQLARISNHFPPIDPAAIGNVSVQQPAHSKPTNCS